MKKFAFPNAAFLAAFLTLPFSPQQEISVADRLYVYKASKSISCTPDRSTISAVLSAAKEITLLPGSGSYVWNIASSSDSAQLYFNQGINSYYGFHIIESMASFKKAAAFDPENPMVWWGQALAYGPNINDVGYNASPDALAATRKAVSLMAKASPAAQALIKAMEVRYSDDSLKTRETLNQAYTDALANVYEKYPDSADVMVLYADAMMLQHPWDLWNVNGTPKPWTPRIQDVLEKALAKDRLHPGANHYYIHIIEPSPNPEKALASADILGKVTPGLAHLVHMPSHIYLRTGEFNRGAEINQEAVDRFMEYGKIFPAVNDAAFLYLLHNQHMLANCAMHAGRYQTAGKAARELQQAIDSATLFMAPPMGSLIQYMYMSPVLLHTRFEQWDSLLSMRQPDRKLVYANILYHFGRGMAYAGKNNIPSATAESEKMAVLMKNADLKIPLTPFSSAMEGAVTASEILKGFISLKENNYKQAVAHLTLAAETEAGMVYNEPRDWFLNPNQYLGSAHLRMKDYAKAEAIFRKDLSLNAKNVWSLHRLEQSLLKQSKKQSASEIQKEFRKASEKADIDFTGLYF